MKTSSLTCFILLFLALSLSGCKEKKPLLSEETFLGEWYTIKGDVEAYSFLKDENSYIFVATQNFRPVVYGTWKTDKDQFIIIMDNGTSITYNYVLLNDTLTFNDGEQIYTRTQPVEVKYPEVKILVTLSGDFGYMKFSKPQPDDLTWDLRVDNTLSSQSVSLNGYSISAGSTLSSNAIKEITDYLKESGFEPDTLYVTEVCNGFRDENQLVTLCTIQSPGATNDSISIRITSALIVK